jgi:methylenetetrahydrofolate reductase (NADPH)
MRGGLSRGALGGAARLLESPRYAVFPGKGTEDTVAQWVPAGMTVTVTASPAKGLDATLELAERLAARGYRVVPHLSARLIRDDAHLGGIVARLTGCGVDDVFVPAGGSPRSGRAA